MNLFRRGKAPDPVDQATPHPLMQAHYDPSLPYWVASDHAVWGTFDNGGGMANACRLADAVAESEPVGERIMVTLNGVVVYSVRGSNQTQRKSARR